MRTLIVIRRGARTIHPSWVGPVRALADIAISTYVDLPEEEGVLLHHRHNGSKNEALYDLFTTRPELLDRYDYVWCLEDDLYVPFASAQGILQFLSRYPLPLCAPALCFESYYSWDNTISNDALVCRGVDFIETMAPVFAVDLLREILPSLIEYPLWGACVTWKRALYERGQIGILFDRFPIVHTRPVGGGELYARSERNAAADLDRAMQTANAPFGTYASSWFGVTHGGEALTGDRLYHAMYAGYRRFFDYHGGAEQHFAAHRHLFHQYGNAFIEKLNFNVIGDVVQDYNRLNHLEDFRAVTDRPWAYGAEGHGDYREIVLRRDGSVEPYHPNEARWCAQEGDICLMEQSGLVSTRFDGFERDGEARMRLTGRYRRRPEVRHYLREVMAPHR